MISAGYDGVASERAPARFKIDAVSADCSSTLYRTDFTVPYVTDSDVPFVTDSDVPSVTDSDVPSVTDSDVPSVTDSDVPSVTGAPKRDTHGEATRMNTPTTGLPRTCFGLP